MYIFKLNRKSNDFKQLKLIINITMQNNHALRNSDLHNCNLIIIIIKTT